MSKDTLKELGTLTFTAVLTSCVVVAWGITKVSEFILDVKDTINE